MNKGEASEALGSIVRGIQDTHGVKVDLQLIEDVLATIIVDKLKRDVALRVESMKTHELSMLLDALDREKSSGRTT